MTEEKLSHGGKTETYSEFIEKFKQKHTTDECYTPPEFYDKIKNYFCNMLQIDPESVIRPFYPDGDYKTEDYTGRVVIDNPPFSILNEIVKFYMEHKIKFVLFAPALQNRYCDGKTIGAVYMKNSIEYENGALVKTCFISNMFSDIILDGTLYQQSKPKRTKTPRPEGVKTSADLCTMTEYGKVKVIKNYEKYKQKKGEHRLFGGAYMIYGEPAEVKPTGL